MRILSYIVIVCLAICAVGRAGNNLVPYPSEDLIGAKLRYYRAHTGEFDQVVVGSSRVLAAVIPEVLDAELAKRGDSRRTFNLAMNAMSPHEADWILRHLARSRPPRLRRVIMELDDWTGRFRKKLHFRHRAFYWHDAETSYAAVRSSLFFVKSDSRRRSQVRAHTLHFLGHVTGLGRGLDLLARRRHGLPWEMSKQQIAERGYVEPGWGRGDRAKRFSGACGARAGEDHMLFYQRALKQMKKRNQRGADRLHFDLRALRRRIETARAAGLEIVHFVPPKVRATPEVRLLVENDHIERALSFNFPEEFPRLYAVENRVDCDHLARSGAEEMSALLAERLASGS